MTATTTKTEPAATPWMAVTSLSVLAFLLVGLEFMPASLLTPIATDLAISEGQAGLSIVVSGALAVMSSLLGNTLLGQIDRRKTVLMYTTALTVSSLAVAMAPNFVVFLAGRALAGIAIGGFWSLSTALAARLARKEDITKAIALLQIGNASALVIAAPLGSFLEALIGWRTTFLVTVPIGVALFVWQFAVLPKMPPKASASIGAMVGLLNRRDFATGMAAIAVAFIGQNTLSIYLRPFLESVTGFHAIAVSFALLGLGLGGLTGLALIGRALRRGINPILIGLPVMTAIIALALIAFGDVQPVTVSLLVLWGLFTSPLIVAWNAWMARTIPDDLEAGGGLQVALMQCALAGGAFVGGVLFDHVGWWSGFLLASLLLIGSALLAAATVRAPAKSSLTYQPEGIPHV
ncbi:MAG: MFS transporter [Paracoccus sp. (in: a-proteobacteria)]|uniref:MFS transporter n=1 Tax=Paracoccus sp. TaxID=267 RepID=UPI0026DEEBA4|nr:MFS transporter [Paracoccus sp. (in: a-proteobacteria)]MDO5613327.1 MFS transporter [Paracoccus sp. (in: a-proteobacteria)]